MSSEIPRPDCWLYGPLTDLWLWPLTCKHHSGLDRLLQRAVALYLRSRLVRLQGIDRITARCGPFIVAANHDCRRDAVLLPVLLMMARHGHPVHFLADWNFKLIPGVGALYRKAGAIGVDRKPARPRVLNRLKPYLTDSIPALDAARAVLDRGGAIALFPEGTTNRRGDHLLRGRHGCARLSLECSAPVLPVGIAYPGHRQRPHKPLRALVEIEVGTPMIPPSICPSGVPTRHQVRAWHGEIMQAIAGLCGKSWNFPDHPPHLYRGTST